MLSHEIDHHLDDLDRRLKSQSMDMELYLKSRELDMDGLREEMTPHAEEHIKQSLTIMQVAEQEKIELTPEELKEKTKETVEEINRVFSKDEARKMTSGASYQNLLNRIASDEITHKTLEYLREIAKGNKPTGKKKAGPKPKTKPKTKTKAKTKSKTKAKAKNQTKSKGKSKIKSEKG